MTDNNGAQASTNTMLTAQHTNIAPTVSVLNEITVIESSSLAITAQGADIDGEIVKYAWTQISGDILSVTPTDNNVLNIEIPKVTKQTQVEFQVEVTDTNGAVGQSTSTVTIVKDNEAPTSVVLVGATALSSNKISVDWLETTDNLIESNKIVYNVHVSNESLTLTSLNNRKLRLTGQASAQIDGLLSNTVYYLLISAEDANGNLSYSNQLRVATMAGDPILSQNQVLKHINNAELTPNAMVYTLSNDETAPQVGEIVVSTGQNGMLRKITAVSNTNGVVSLQTEPAALNELYDDVDINTTIKLIDIQDSAGSSNDKQNQKGVSLSQQTPTETEQQRNLQWPDSHLSISHTVPIVPLVRTTQSSVQNIAPSQTIQDKHILLSGPSRIAFTPGVLNTLKIDASLINDPNNELEFSDLTLIGLTHNGISPIDENYGARAINIAPNAALDPQELNAPQASNKSLQLEWTPLLQHIDTLSSQPYIATFRAKVVKRNCSISCAQSTATLHVKIKVGGSELSARSALAFESSDEIIIKGNGQYAFEPTVNVRAKIEDAQLREALATVKGYLDFQVDVDLIAEKSGSVNGQLQLIQKSFTKQLSVGGVPVIVRGEFNLSGKYNGIADEALNISQSLDVGVYIDAGFEYKNGKWEKVFASTPNLSYQLTSGANSQARTNLTLMPELKLWVYESNAGHIKVQPSVYSELSLDGEFVGFTDQQIQNDTSNDYRFTSLNAGMSTDLQLRANFTAFDKSVVAWPNEDANQLNEFVVLEKKPLYGIPNVLVKEVPALASFSSCAINASAEITPLNTAFRNTENNWDPSSAIWTLSLIDDDIATLVDTSASINNNVVATHFDANSNVEILATTFSEYQLRFSGHSEIGAWANQYQDIRFDLRDNNNDSLPDYWASRFNVSNANEDADGDGIDNANEFLNCTFPNNSDSDSDGMPDGWEVAYSLNPNVNDANEDSDADNRTNLQEFLDDSNPQLIDINEPPIATIDQDQTVDEYALVQLIGSASDGGSISKVLWTQVSGPLIGLANTNELTISFVAPQVDETTVLGFKLEVTDNSGALDSAQVLITVNPINDKPVAIAGADLIFDSGELAVLDASGSTDTDGNIVSYEWRVHNGQTLAIANPNSVSTSFVTPEVVVTTVFEIGLTVVDNDGAFDTSVINVTVNPIADPPVLTSLKLTQLNNTVVVFRGLDSANMNTTIALFLNAENSKVYIAQEQLAANGIDITSNKTTSILSWDVTDNELNIHSTSLSNLLLDESLTLSFNDGKIDLYEKANTLGDTIEVAELYKLKSLTTDSLEGYQLTILQNTQNRVIDFVTHNRVFSYTQDSQNIEPGEWLYSNTIEGKVLALSMQSGEVFSEQYQSFTTGASLLDSFILNISVLPEIENPLSEAVFADNNLNTCVQNAAVENNWLSINDVTHLKCSSQNIQSTQGLEQLRNLVSLNLSDNALQSINLSEQNELSELNLSDNQLNNINFTFNPKLELVTLNNNDFSSATNTYLSSITWIDQLLFDEIIVSPGGSDFVMRLTINESQVFRIITNDNFEYDYSVDWGDGTITSNHSEDAQNTYLTAGVYEITVSGDYPAFKFCENNDGCSDFKLDILHWGSNQWRSMESTFSGLNAITILAQDIPDFSSTTNLSFMFYKTPNFNSDISSWDTSNITDMNFMFGFASSFNGDIARWDTSSVTNMGGLFYFAESFNNDISQWNTSAVTRMHSLFAFATKFNTDISQWDTSSVTYMATMFLGASNFNGTLSNWDVSKVYDMNKMFYNATSMTGDLRTWVLAAGVRHSSFTHKDSLLIEPNW